MKVFISWSGEVSRQVAEALRDWLPDVIQSVEPWLSSADLDKGTRWNEEINKQLKGTIFGIACLTPGNLESRWIHWETGALARHRDSKIWTYLVDVKHTDVLQPLAQFNHTNALDKDDTFRMLDAVNKALNEGSLLEERLRRIFDKHWPELEQRLAAARKQKNHKNAAVRTDRQILEEILALVRYLSPTPDRDEWLDVLRRWKAHDLKTSDFDKLSDFLLHSFWDKKVASGEPPTSLPSSPGPVTGKNPEFREPEKAED